MTDTSDEQTPKMNLKFKTTQTTHELEVPVDATIDKIKEILSEKIKHPKERLTLIFSGKILKDPDTISSYGVKDGMVIHMVLRADPSASPPAPASAAAASRTSAAPSSNTSSTTGQVPQASPFASMFQNLPPNIAQQAASVMTPDVMNQMLNTPLVQNMMNDPNIIRSIFAENPAVQQIIQRNPELGHVLNDPEVIRQTFEVMRNPNMFNEMMRNHDQAIRNLQGTPGGEAALQRMYQDVQEPLLNSGLGTLRDNMFAANPSANDADATSRSQRAGVENAEALPNPWSSGASGGGNQQRAAAGGNSQSSQGMPNMMGNLASAISPEMMSSVMRSLANQPELMNSLTGGMGGRMGALLNQVNPATLANPRVMEALSQIHAATMVLRQEAPELAALMSGGMLPPPPGAHMPTGGNSEGATGGSAGAPPSAGQPNMRDIASMLQNLNMGGAGGAGGFGGGGASMPPPEERYRSQLEQLVSMGFSDQTANIAALTATFGDVSAAIERLLSGNGGAGGGGGA